MIYKDFQDLKLSALGFGTMRLPILNGNFSQIDETETELMVKYALENGINYFDTAWGYHDGQSEIAIGKALKNHPRESFFLADKFPGYDLNNMDKVTTIFPEQLKKCGVSYFDFYLIHNVCELNIDAYLNESYGIFPYLLKQKEQGRIKHLGFSVHSNFDNMKRFLAAYGDYMEFCQVQLNYLDWSFQDAKAKVELLNEYNIPIWVMEPLRGGQLATLSNEDTKKLNLLRPDETIPSWAFRFIQSIPNVKVTLSGMSNLKQVKDNIYTFLHDKPLEKHELDTILNIADSMVKKIVLPCTSCRYCTTHCPQQLDIPSLISLYNEHCFTGGGFIAPMALMAIPKEKHPDACIACKKCESVCPQLIKISDAMADFSKQLEALEL